VDLLSLNGLQIYPIDPLSMLSADSLTASQMIESPLQPHLWVDVGNPKLVYQLSIRGPAPHFQGEDLGLITFDLSIVEVAGEFVHGIDNVVLKILKTPSGKLMIGNLETTPSKSTLSTSNPAQDCTSIVCKWREIIADRLSKVKGCGGKSRPANSVAPGPSEQNSQDMPYHGSHRPHSHHNKHHRIVRFLKSIVLHVFIPIAIGVVAGVTASLVGMVVGHLIVFLWRKTFRRATKGTYSKVQQGDTFVEDASDESKLSEEHQGPPPIYEEALIDEKALE